MSEAVRLGVIVPSVNIVVEEWHPIIEALEGIIGKPVVTSTQAVLRHLLRLARVATPIHGFGRLLREH
jgi:maleate cis-trans isomerase